jgi:acyl-CoA synthetase (AMP-forming)/AMP-acid ligase II
MLLAGGCTLIVRRKFSASQFFRDCARHGATVTQYIGELCRYLLATPADSATDRGHSLRIAIGNGLRPEIWASFQKRFGIREIGEFYGATEGNGALVNHCRSAADRGAVGRMGLLLRAATGYRLCRFDVENEAPLRDEETGFCLECGVDEPGELLMPIKAGEPSTQFAGYNSAEATRRKIAQNVFVRGDKYFRSGDLLRRDKRGYYHFVDRIGDTFRWKGENCSTSEVAKVVSVFSGVEECNVYGVLIPENRDGRAPMAAIVPRGGDVGAIDMAGLAQHVQRELPSYARPVFLRILPKQAVTSTFKHKKVQLRKQGCDPSAVDGDALYWLPTSGARAYVPFGAPELHRIVTGKARL